MRALSEIELRILGMIEPEAKALDLEIVRVRVMGSRTPILQIMAELPDGTMTVEKCAKLSRRLSPLLDAEDPIVSEYTLEVSSPGIDRPLTRAGDFARWVSHEVRIEIGMPVDGRKRFHGVIDGEQDGVVTVTLKDGGTAQIAITEMIKASLVLTDRLIKDVQSLGQAPEETDTDALAGDFDDLDVIDDEDADADGDEADADEDEDS
jgi:ribosome maturation factor RimP